MSTITVSVHRTAGAGPGGAHGDIEQRMSGYALGSGTITDTLGPDGKQLEALVLLREPALPGIEVTACPIKLLHLHLDGAAHPVVLCLQPDQHPAPLGDLSDLSHPAANEPLREAIHRLHGEHVCVVLDSQDGRVRRSDPRSGAGRVPGTDRGPGLTGIATRRARPNGRCYCGSG